MPNNKNIAIHDVLPGMVIVSVVQQNGPIKIKKSGLVTSQEMVQGLVEMGIQKVEIDPDQTVEIDALEQPVIKKSATQRMLESNTVTDTRIDDNLSSQFHRSLFLPTVQDMPSAWQYYARRYVLVAFIALGGFGLGWTLANYQSVLNFFVSNLPQALPLKIQKSIDALPTLEQVNASPESIPALVPPPVVVKPNAVPTSEPERKVQDIPQIVEQKIEPKVADTSKISHDLLSKFNKAIAKVSEKTEPLEPVTQVSNEGALRIDQLPAWVMTQLPSMSFSAHMYASESTERWVRVNGTRMIEGDVIDNKVEILRIEPQHVILNYSGQEFSMAALTDW